MHPGKREVKKILRIAVLSLSNVFFVLFFRKVESCGGCVMSRCVLRVVCGSGFHWDLGPTIPVLEVFNETK